MTNDSLLERKTARAIIGAFYDVYNELGYGFLENITRLRLSRSWWNEVIL